MNDDERRILVARKGALVIIDGKKHFLHRDRTTVHAGHPIVRGREDLFRELKVDYALPEEEPEPTPEPEPAPEEKSEPKPAARKRAPAKKTAESKKVEATKDEE